MSFNPHLAKAVVLIGFVLAAAITDVARHKIYNWTVYPGILAGFVLNGWAAFWTRQPIGDALGDSLYGFLACGTIMLVCFVFFDMGGGDVKLVAMMGAFLGVQQGIEAMLWTFVLGSIVGCIILIWQIGVRRIVSKTFGHVWLVLRAKGWIPLTREERAPLKRWLFLAPSGLAAVCLVTVREYL